MYKRLLGQEPFLRLLSRSSAKSRKVLLQQASKKELTTLFEICLNIIKGNIPLTNTQLKKLKKHQKLIRALSDKKISLRQKKLIVNQKGGAIRAVVGTIASLVLPLLAKLIK
jgi:hypothetical protein